MDTYSQNAQLTTPLTKDNILNIQEPKINPTKDNKMVIKPCTIGHCVVFDIMFVSLFLFFGCLFGSKDSYTAFMILSIGTVLSLIILIFLFTRTDIIKDIPNKKIIFIKKNIYGCRKKEAVFNEKIHFYKTFHITYDEDNSHREDYFYAINDFKNITLDLKIVKQKPIELFHYYKNWEYATDLFKLNQFVGSPVNFDNPLIFDIKKYMGKNQTESNPVQPFEFSNQQLSRIMKFNEHLFTYYIRFPYETKIKDIHMNRTRIDFVFSEKYDEIFIGIVKANIASYEKTFQYEMNIIDKFLVDKKSVGNSYEIDLEVALKNTPSVEHICNIKNVSEINAEGLIYLLNEKLSLKPGNTNNNFFNNNEVTPNY